jgi:hypothetical protein
MTFKNLSILLFLLNITFSNAQKLELGKVSIEELAEKVHPIDASAVAAILFKKGTVRFEYSQDNGFVMLTEVKTRIKIYKKEGYDWANKIVQYNDFGQFKETVIFDDAFTYNLVNGKIEKTKLKSDGVFNEKVNKYWSRKKITMPNIKEGSVIEFSYIIKSPNIGEMMDWSFQTSIPVNFSEFKTYIPEYFIYKPNQKGFVFPKVAVEKMQKTVSYFYKPAFNPGGNNSTSQEKLEFEETQTTYLSTNLPAMKEEAFVNNIENYTSTISHELSMIRYPNQPFKAFATDWEAVTKKIYDNEDFGDELNKNGYFEDDVKTLLTGITDVNEKIGMLFKFVKSKVKWNDFTGYACNDGVKKAYKDGVGNVAEINLMLTSMLRFAGLDANPVLVSTRSNGIALFPSRAAFNYVICGVQTAEGLILLDATEKYAVPNVLPLRDLNWLGRLIRKDGTSESVELMPTNYSNERTMLNFALDNKGAIEGTLKQQLTNHNALEFRKKYNSTSKETYLENLENRYNNIEINDYVRDNESDLDKGIVESFGFKDTKDVEIINNKIYFSPLLFLAEKENPFKQEVREYPLDFGFPTNDQQTITVEIPEGYAVESIPKSLNIASGENVATYKYLIENEENKINIAISSSINEPIVPEDFYEVLKSFYKQVVEKQNEKIVLVKKK